MLIANLVSDVFLGNPTRGTFNLYALKKGSNKMMLIATLYEEWHAVKMRMMFRELYGLRPQDVSTSDCMYTNPIREKRMQEKIRGMNAKSTNRVVRAHANAETRQLASDILKAITPFDPASRASEILHQLDLKGI
jgi:hypothetical protein